MRARGMSVGSGSFGRIERRESDVRGRGTWRIACEARERRNVLVCVCSMYSDKNDSDYDVLNAVSHDMKAAV